MATLFSPMKVYEEIAEFLALKNSIGAIRAADLKPGEPLKTKVDLGCNFYVQVSSVLTICELRNVIGTRIELVNLKFYLQQIIQ